MTRRWYVVHTQPNAEAKAAFNLARQGFQAYLPRYRKLRRHARQIQTIAAPLFPRYVFVALDLAIERWRCIRSTIGVSAIVTHGELPAPVPKGVIEEIKSREDDGGIVEVRPLINLQRGQAVRITQGALFDHTGLFEEMTDDRRVAILLDLLGRRLRVFLPEGFVTAAA